MAPICTPLIRELIFAAAAAGARESRTDAGTPANVNFVNSRLDKIDWLVLFMERVLAALLLLLVPCWNIEDDTGFGIGEATWLATWYALRSTQSRCCLRCSTVLFKPEPPRRLTRLSATTPTGRPNVTRSPTFPPASSHTSTTRSARSTLTT